MDGLSSYFCRVYFGSVPFKKVANMFEHVEIGEYICDGVVEPSTKKIARADSNHTGHSSKMRGICALSKNNSDMGHAGRNKTRCVDLPIDELEPTCKINHIIHS